jgi:hypothetical protein
MQYISKKYNFNYDSFLNCPQILHPQPVGITDFTQRLYISLFIVLNLLVILTELKKNNNAHLSTFIIH